MKGSVVYVIQAEHGGPVKIGYCGRRSGVLQRLSDLQVGNSYRLVVRNVIDAPHGVDDEHRLHDKLAEYRLVGEWFMDCPAVAMEVRVALPAKGDDGRRMQPLVDSAFAAGREFGRKEAEANTREDMKWWCESTLDWFANQGAPLEGSAERAARKAAKLAGVAYPGDARTAQLTAHKQGSEMPGLQGEAA